MTDRTVSVRLRMEVADAVTKTKLASKAVQDFGRQTSISLDKHRRSWDDVATSATMGGAAIGVAVGGAVKSFADFDAEMSRVGASADVNGKALDALRDSAIKAGAATKFSATDAARAENELVKAGLSVTEVIGGGLTGALDLATAGQIDIAKAAELSASAMTQFGLTGKDSAHIADVLAAGAGKAQGSVEDMGMALQQSGLVAAQYGLSLDQSVGTLAMFAKAGLIGSDAGTSFKTMLMRLNPQSKEAADLMDSLGLRAYDAQGNFVGLSAYAGKLQKALSGMADEQRDATLQTLFGADAVRAANILYRNGAAGVEKWTDNVNDSGFAARQSAAQMDNLKGDVEKLKGSLETAFITAGSVANDFTRDAVQGLNKVIEVWGALPPIVQKGTLTVGGLSAATLLGLAGAVKLVGAYRDLNANLKTMGPLGNRAAAGLSRTTALLGGPWGAALAVGTIALGVFAAKHAESKARVEDLTEALREDSGVLAQNSRAWAVKALQDKGALKAAQETGFGLDVVTDAALGNAEAMERVNARFKYLRENSRLQGGDLEVDVDKASAELRLKRALASVQKDVRKGTQEYQLQTAALGEVKEATEDVTPPTQRFAVTAQEAAAGISETDTAADRAAKRFSYLKDQIDALNAPTLDLRSAQRQWQQAIDDVNASMKENGRSLDITKVKGRANQEALDGMARAALAQGQAVLDATGSDAKMRDSLIKSKAELQKVAEKFTHSKTKAKELADQLIKIPPAEITVRMSGLEQAQRKIAALSDDIRQIPSLQAAIHAGLNPTKRAAGGLIPGPPSTADTVPAYLSTGEYVVKASAVQKYGVHMFDALNAQKFANGGVVGTGAAGIGELLSSYAATYGRPVESGERASALSKRRSAVESLRIAEMRLHDVQRKRGRTAAQIAAAEERVRRAREGLAAATRAVADVERRTQDSRRGPLQRLGSALSVGVRDGAAFVRNIEALSARGFGELARQLAEQGDTDAERIAAAAVRAKPAEVSTIQRQLNAATTIAGQRERLADIVRLIDAMRVRPGGSIAELAAQSGLDAQAVVDVARLIGAPSLAGLPGGKHLASLLPAYAGGGFVGGPPSTSDTVPAWLSTGEYVVRASAVQAVGTSFLDRVNAAGRYASGGLVAASRAAASTSTTYGGDTLQFSLDSAVAARQAQEFVAAGFRAQAQRAALRSRRRP